MLNSCSMRNNLFCFLLSVCSLPSALVVSAQINPPPLTPGTGTTGTGTTGTPVIGTTTTTTTSTAPTTEVDAPKGFAPFRLLIGTNLDLLDGIGASKLYAQMNYTLPIGEEQEQSHWLTSFSIYQNNFFGDSTDNRTKSRVPVTRIVRPNRPPVRDSVLIKQTLYDGKSFVENKILGLNAMVGRRVFATGAERDVRDINTELKTINIYFAIKAEYFRRSTTITTAYDSIAGSTATYLVPARSGVRTTTLERNHFSQENVFFWGVGVPLLVITDTYEVRIDPFIGIQGGTRKSGAYSAAFNVTEKKYGISIGGTYRGYLDGGEPIVNLYIAKAFTVEDIKQVFGFN